MAKIYAIAIFSGKLTLEDIPVTWRKAAADEYERLYGHALK